jgi:hypothetical protein
MNYLQINDIFSKINFSLPSRFFYRGVAQLGLERLLWEQEAAGSSPVTPIFTSLDN